MACTSYDYFQLSVAILLYTTLQILSFIIKNNFKKPTQANIYKWSFICFWRRISLAEAHCKLCLRTRVLEEDAVIAVLLCENSVTLKHGSIFFGSPPP